MKELECCTERQSKKRKIAPDCEVRQPPGKGGMNVARQFTAGKEGGGLSPVGTAEPRARGFKPRDPPVVPTGLLQIYGPSPGSELPGYSHSAPNGAAACSSGRRGAGATSPRFAKSGRKAEPAALCRP